jgi:hypothetical protein
MRIRASVVLGIGLASVATTAATDTFYKYRDPRSGRDVFVNRLDQVPLKYRGQAKVVLEVPGARTEPSNQTSTEVVEVPADTGRPLLLSKPAVANDPRLAELRAALHDHHVWKAIPLLVGRMVDAKLVAKGAPPLDPAEQIHLGRLMVTIVVASLVAGLAALAAWIVIMVTAIRDGRGWWAFFIFLLSPLGYVYVFLHGGKGRALWKSLCSLGMLCPALVGLIGAWRFSAWFTAVIEARGGHL